MNCFFTATIDDCIFLIVQTRAGEVLDWYWAALSVCHKQSGGLWVFLGNLDSASLPLSLRGKLKIRKWTEDHSDSLYRNFQKNPHVEIVFARPAKFAWAHVHLSFSYSPFLTRRHSSCLQQKQTELSYKHTSSSRAGMKRRAKWVALSFSLVLCL